MEGLIRILPLLSLQTEGSTYTPNSLSDTFTEPFGYVPDPRGLHNLDVVLPLVTWGSHNVIRGRRTILKAIRIEIKITYRDKPLRGNQETLMRPTSE